MHKESLSNTMCQLILMLNVALSPSFELNVFFSFSYSLSGTTQIKESSAFKCKECCPL